MSNRKCPNCGLINVPDAAQCERCAVPLTDKHGAYAPGDLGAQAGDPRAQYAQAETPDETAYQQPFTYTAYQAPYVAPFKDVGAAFNQAWRIYTQNFMLIAKLVLFAAIPFALGQAAMAYRLQSVGTFDFSSGLNLFIFTLVRWSLIPPTVIYAVLQVRRTGKGPSVGESYRWGASRWLRVTLGLSLSWLLAFCPMALVGILVSGGAAAGGAAESLWIVAFLLFLVLLIPCIIVSMGFSLVVPVAALENKWPLDALARSWHMTKGVRGRIFGALFVTGLLLIIAGIVINVFVAGTASLLISPYIGTAISAVIGEVIGQLMTVTGLVIYLGLLAPDEQRQTVDALGTDVHG